jgi:hypothetical protein
MFELLNLGAGTAEARLRVGALGVESIRQILTKLCIAMASITRIG